MLQLIDKSILETPLYINSIYFHHNPNDQQGYRINDVTLDTTRFPNFFTDIPALFELSEDRILIAFGYLEIVVLLWCFLGVVKTTCWKCKACNGDYAWHSASMEYRHTCCDGHEYKIHILHTSFIFSDTLNLTKKYCEFCKFLLYFLTPGLTQNRKTRFCGAGKTVCCKWKQFVINVCCWFERENPIELQRSVQFDATFFRKPKKPSQKHKGRPLMPPKHAHLRMLSLDKNEKNQRPRMTKVHNTESVQAVTETGLLGALSTNTLIRGDLGAIVRSNKVREKFPTEGCNHRRGHYTDPATLHERYDERISSNVIENSFRTDKRDNAYSGGIKRIGNDQVVQDEATFRDWVNNRTTKCTKDALKIFLLSVQSYQDYIMQMQTEEK